MSTLEEARISWRLSMSVFDRVTLVALVVGVLVYLTAITMNMSPEIKYNMLAIMAATALARDLYFEMRRL